MRDKIVVGSVIRDRSTQRMGVVERIVHLKNRQLFYLMGFDNDKWTKFSDGVIFVSSNMKDYVNDFCGVM